MTTYSFTFYQSNLSGVVSVLGNYNAQIIEIRIVDYVLDHYLVVYKCNCQVFTGYEL